jgi:hypothetical protein
MMAKFNRESWLQSAVKEVSLLFRSVGYSVPKVQISVGFTGSGKHTNSIGECWPTVLALDNVNHIFITPTLDEPVQILEVIVHELVHAIDDCNHKHGQEFKLIATKIGLEGPMRATTAGATLSIELHRVAKLLGKFPHKKLKLREKRLFMRKRPSAECPKCEYRVPMLKLYLQFGAPLCPIHKVQMKQVGDWSWK